MKHVLTFDIEDWFHIMEIPELENRKAWIEFPSIVEEKTALILEILDEYDTKATFFVLGWVADNYPKIATAIVEKGHELATHGYWHRRVYEQSPESFRDGLKKSVGILQEQTGEKIIGYRAPSFSITPGNEWAFDIIKELGLEYDSSLFPAKRGHGGFPCDQNFHSIKTINGDLTELPMSVLQFGPFKMPFSGGGYLRALPLRAIMSGFRAFEKKGIPVVVYLHPRDFAPDHPRVKMPLNRKFKSYIGLNSTERKLRNLLETFEFDTCWNVLANEIQKREELEECLVEMSDEKLRCMIINKQ